MSWSHLSPSLTPVGGIGPRTAAPHAKGTWQGVVAGDAGDGCKHMGVAIGAAAQGAACSSAENISQGTSVKTRVEDTSPVLLLGSAASQAAEKMGCPPRVMGTTRCLPGQGTFFQAKSLELRLFCFTRFLRASCSWHSLSPCNHQFISPPQMMLPSALLLILANSSGEMWPPHVGSN